MERKVCEKKISGKMGEGKRSIWEPEGQYHRLPEGSGDTLRRESKFFRLRIWHTKLARTPSGIGRPGLHPQVEHHAKGSGFLAPIKKVRIYRKLETGPPQIGDQRRARRRKGPRCPVTYAGGRASPAGAALGSPGPGPGRVTEEIWAKIATHPPAGLNRTAWRGGFHARCCRVVGEGVGLSIHPRPRRWGGGADLPHPS